MSRPIADYALIGDTRTTALISSEGSIDWLCWPRPDSPAVLTRLLDDPHGGSARVEFFDGAAPVSRCYEDGTNILRTSIVGPAGRGVLIDLMPIASIEPLPAGGPDGDAPQSVLRIVQVSEGRLSGRFVLRATPGDGLDTVGWDPEGDRTGRLRVEGGDGPVLRVESSHPVQSAGDAIAVDFTAAPSEDGFFAFGLQLPDSAPTALRTTRDYWLAWRQRLRYDGPYRASVERSALVLKLLTHAPSGAIIAAPTTSLPEAVPGNRNFDYRYSWIRDASFSVTALCGLGLQREAAEYLRFLCRSDPGPEPPRLLRTVDGAVPEERILGHLPGWRGVGPVRAGNAASVQRQLDTHGEFLLALHAYLEAVGFEPPESIRSGLVARVTSLADETLRRQDDDDQGIWEFRDAVPNLQHTKALLWVALDRAVRIAARFPGFAEPAVEAWRAAAADLRVEYESRSWNAQRQAYVQSYGSDRLDAAVLRTVLFDALDAGDPRTHATLAAIDRELRVGDLCYRYRHPDGWEGEEGTFTACAFWRVGVLALGGRTRDARDTFERLLIRGNDLGLYAEQIDPRTGEQRGNFPQGFTHMAIVNHALRLAKSIERFGLR